MSELPQVKVTMEGSEFIATPENTSLFRFVGELAIFNHVFFESETEGTTMRGSYLFRHANGFERLEQFMVENGFPLHDNMREVPECDFNALEQSIKQSTSDLEAGVPEHWV